MDVHLGLEDAGFNPHPQTPDRIHEMRKKGLGLGRFFGSIKTGPSSLPDRAGQRKLRDCQDFASDIHQGKIHLSGFIGKNPKFGGLQGQMLCIPFRIPLSHTHQKAEPPAAPANRPAFDLDPSLLDALQDDFHRALSIFFHTVLLSPAGIHVRPASPGLLFQLTSQGE
jgi:hypothetical protein